MKTGGPQKRVQIFQTNNISRAISRSSCILRSPLAENMGCWIKKWESQLKL